MKTIEQFAEQFTSRTILTTMADIFRQNNRDFFDDEVCMLTAVATLKKELPSDFSPSVDAYIQAHETDVLAQIVYAGYNGFQINSDNFHAPFGIDFTRWEFFDIAKEHIIGHFPVNYEANAVIEAFFKALPEELREYETHISEYFTHFECAGPKLAHYAGYMLGNELLPWLVPGYRMDPVQTMKYESEMEKYCGYKPL